MSRKHILITGGAGFIGSHLAMRCIREGLRVTVVDNLVTGKASNIPPEADFLELDLSKEDTYKRLPAHCDAVFHLAAQSSGEISNEEPRLDFKTNGYGTLLLLEWCKAISGSMRFLYSSSMAVYGNPKEVPVTEDSPKDPLSFYAISKLASEYYILRFLQFGIVPTIFRLFSVYGPGQDLANKKQGIVSIYLSFLVEGEKIQVKGSGERFRDLVYIDDVVDIWMNALNNKKTFGNIYNLCTGKKTLVKELVEAEIKAMGHNPIEYPVRYEGSTPADQFGLYGDRTRLDRDIPHGPFMTLEEGLRRTVEWVRNTDIHR